MRSQSLRTKIMILIAVPILGLVWLSLSMLQTAFERREEARSAERLAHVMDLSVKTGNLLHESQKERGMTAVFMSSGGERFRNEIGEQRRATDERLGEWKKAIETSAADFPVSVTSGLESAKSALDELSRRREQATSLSVKPVDVTDYFTSTHAKLLAALGALASSSDDAALRGRSIAYLTFLSAKEKTGAERANLANVFGSGSFVPGQYERVVSLISARDSYLAVFRIIAEKDVLEPFVKNEAAPVVGEVTSMERIAVERGSAGNFGVDSSVWYQKMTERINLMKQVEDAQVASITTVAGALLAESRAAERRSFATAIPLVLASLALVVLAFRLVRNVSNLLEKTARVLEEVAAGNLDVRLEADASAGEEIRRVSVALNQAVESMGQTVHAIRQRSELLASGAEELTAVSREMANGARETSNHAAEASHSSEQMRANISAIAAASEEMNASVAEISNNAANAATIASSAVDVAAGTNASVGQLQASSDEIGSVIGLIDGIAKQTNLLALNATIEAARAGDSGKGFAVVAHEVKELAQQTGSATGDVSRRVDGIRGEMVHVVDALGKISEVIGKIHETQTAIAGAVEEQTATTAEMSRSIAEVAAGSSVIADSVSAFAEQAKHTSAGATQTEQSAGEFARVATELREIIARFRVSAH